MFSFLGSKGADTLLCICTYQLGGNLFMRRLISVIKIRVLASKIAIHLQEVVLYSKITFILSKIQHPQVICRIARLKEQN